MEAIYKLKSKQTGNIFYGYRLGNTTTVFSIDGLNCTAEYTDSEIEECFEIIEARVASISMILASQFKV